MAIPTPGAAAEKQLGIAIGQIFLEEATFFHRPDSLGLPPSTKPEVGDLRVSMQAGVPPNERAGILRVSVATRDDATLLYRFSVTMVGLFEQRPGEETMPIREFIQGPAISMLFPFIREAVASLTGRGRFGPVWLNPFNAQEASKGFKAAEPPQERPKP